MARQTAALDFSQYVLRFRQNAQLQIEVTNEMNDNKGLSGIINVHKWQVLQDYIAKVTGMAVITSDCKGVPITAHSGRQSFCSHIRADAGLNEFCQKCDSRAGLEAMRVKAPYIYQCHYGILDVAIPIVIGDSYIGAILIGQVLLSNAEDMATLEVIYTPTNRKLHQRGLAEFMEFYEKLPVLSLERVQVIAQMLFHLCNYIVEESIEKNMILDMIAGRDIPASDEGMTFQKTNLNMPVERLEGIKKKLNNAISDAHVHNPEETERRNETGGNILDPAFEYIKTHKSERCSLTEMSGLCHISKNYFHKLFVKQTGMTYSAFLIGKRLDWAKRLLQTTDRSISQIAIDVGFSDAGHFIKTFKKYEGITPLRFRAVFAENEKI